MNIALIAHDAKKELNKSKKIIKKMRKDVEEFLENI